MSAQEAHEKIDVLMTRNRSVVEQKKLTFQQNESKARMGKRIAFGQQKSMSCKEDQSTIENCSYRNVSKKTLVEKRMNMAGNKKKSYSFDEKTVQSYIPVMAGRLHEGEVTDTAKLTVHQLFEAFNSQQQNDVSRAHQRKFTKAPKKTLEVLDNVKKNEEKSKSRENKSKKLSMLHDCKALHECSFDDAETADRIKRIDENSKKESAKKAHAGKSSEGGIDDEKSSRAGQEEQRNPRKASMTCRFPIARLFGRFKMERPKK